MQDSIGKAGQEKFLLLSHGRAYNSAFDLGRKEECFVSEKFGKILNTSLDRERKFQDFLNIFIHSFIHSSFTPQTFFNIYTSCVVETLALTPTG